MTISFLPSCDGRAQSARSMRLPDLFMAVFSDSTNFSVGYTRRCKLNRKMPFSPFRIPQSLGLPGVLSMKILTSWSVHVLTLFVGLGAAAPIPFVAASEPAKEIGSKYDAVAFSSSVAVRVSGSDTVLLTVNERHLRIWDAHSLKPLSEVWPLDQPRLPKHRLRSGLTSRQ